MGNISLKIILLYADRSSGELGKEVTESLREKLGGAFNIRRSSWNMELLRSPKLRALAALEAAEADIVMVALDEGTPLSREVRMWFNLWRRRARVVPCALVALLKRDEESSPRVVEQALHRIAKSARMDFFAHTETKREYPRLRVTTPALAAALH